MAAVLKTVNPKDSWVQILLTAPKITTQNNKRRGELKMDLDEIKKLEAWADCIEEFSDDDNLLCAASHMRLACSYLKNKYYKERKTEGKK